MAFQIEIPFPNCQHGTFLSTSNPTHPGCTQSFLFLLREAPAHPAHRPEASHAFCMLSLPHSYSPFCPARPLLSFHHLSIPTCFPVRCAVQIVQVEGHYNSVISQGPGVSPQSGRVTGIFIYHDHCVFMCLAQNLPVTPQALCSSLEFP